MMTRFGGLVVVAVVALSMAGCAGGDRREHECRPCCASQPPASSAPPQRIRVDRAQLLCEYHEYSGGGSAVFVHSPPVTLPLDTEIVIEGTAQAYGVAIFASSASEPHYVRVGREVNANSTHAAFLIPSAAGPDDAMFMLHAGWVMGSDHWPRTESPWVVISSVEPQTEATGARFGLHVKSPTLFAQEEDRVFGMGVGSVPATSRDIGASTQQVGDNQYAVDRLIGPLTQPDPVSANSLEWTIRERMKFLGEKVNCKLPASAPTKRGP